MNIEEMDNFVFLWREYAKAPNDELTSGAIELKKELIEHAKYFMPFSLGGFRQGDFRRKKRDE